MDIHLSSYIPGTFWFGWFNVMEKVDQIEEVTECSIVTDDIDGHSTIDEGTEKPSFREGQVISSIDEKARPMECVFNTMPKALFHWARLGDEEMIHFFPQKSAKIKRIGYALVSVILFAICTSHFITAQELSDRTEALSPEEQLIKFNLADGFVIELVAQ